MGKRMLVIGTNMGVEWYHYIMDDEGCFDSSTPARLGHKCVIVRRENQEVKVFIHPILWRLSMLHRKEVGDFIWSIIDEYQPDENQSTAQKGGSQ